MAQSQRDRLAVVIRGWHGAARSLESRPAAVAACEPLLNALTEHLSCQSTMAELAEAYLADGGSWPADLSRPLGVSTSIGVEVVVAASYWRRYRQLIERATCQAKPTSDDGDGASTAAAQPAIVDIDPIALGYTVKLWQRGPSRLRCMPIERLNFYERLVDEAYGRIADCETVCELARRYYADGDWVLEMARRTLPAQGERPSAIGWIQDAAYWRRHQELTTERIRQEESERPKPDFALWLAQHMARHHLSVPEMAHRLSVEGAVVRDWLGATSLPSAEHEPRIAALFGLSDVQLPRAVAAALA